MTFKRLLNSALLTLIWSIWTINAINILHLHNHLEICGENALKLQILDYLNSTGQFTNFVMAASDGVWADRFAQRSRELVICPTPNMTAEKGMELAKWSEFTCRLIATVRRHNIDIIHSAHWQTSLCAKTVSKSLGIPVIEDYHFLADFWGDSSRRPFDTMVEETHRPLLTRLCAAHGIAQSFGFRPEDCIVIPNGIDAQEGQFNQAWRDEVRKKHNISPDCYVFGAIGRLSPEKNFQHLIKLFIEFLEKNPFAHVHLMIVGDGPERGALEAMISEKELSNHVTLVGFVNNVPHYASAFDSLFCTSTSEGFALAVLQGLASGLETFSTISFVGLEEIIKPVTVEAVTEHYLKENPATYPNREPFRASKLPEFYKIERMLEDYRNLYLKLAQK